MVTFEALKKLALSFPETSEAPHFEKTSFRVKGKIFATYDRHTNRACIKLGESDQDIFSLGNGGVIFPVDNKWGKQGWTIVELAAVGDELFAAALTTAYRTVAPKKLSDLMKF